VIVNNQNVNNNTLITQVIQQQQQVQTVLQSTVVTPPPPPPQAPTLSATDNFQVLDEASQTGFHTPGTPYSGTVVGVENEYVNLNPTNLDVTAITPNAFIQTGNGNDALEGYTGRNVLDAGAGSNVVVGGAAGNTTFLASVASASTQGAPNVIDLLKNFHGGDDAIIRGLNASDFTLNISDATGAFGAELLVVATSNVAGGPSATVAIAGLTSGDLASGRLSISFSTDPSNGQPYMLIHANS